MAQHSHAGDRRLTLRDVPWDLPHLGRLLPGVLVSAGAGLVGLSWGAGLLPLAWALPAGLGVVVAGLWRAMVVGRAEGTAQVAAAEKAGNWRCGITSCRLCCRPPKAFPVSWMRRRCWRRWCSR